METQNKAAMRAGRTVAALLAVLLLLAALPIGASAATVRPPSGAVTTDVYLNDAEILDGECIIYRSVTYVPLRNFCNLLASCDFSWDGKTGTATVTTKDLTLTVQNGALYIIANGHYFYTVEAVMNLDGSLYVPIRPLARAFAVDVVWNNAARRVELSPVGTKRAVEPAAYNADDVYWLSRIISSESKGEPFRGQIAVGNVVLNRVRSSAYPNTIWGVIFDRKHGTQFSPVSFGTIYQTPSASSVIAAKICLEGYSISDKALFFVNPRIATNSWIQKNRPYAFTIGNHDFYN